MIVLAAGSYGLKGLGGDDFWRSCGAQAWTVGVAVAGCLVLGTHRGDDL